MSAKLKLNDFIFRSNITHDFFYDYSITNLGNNNKEKVNIRCPKHGIFAQSANNHLNGQKCPICKGKFKYSTETFIQKSKDKFGNTYDYSLTKYRTNKTNVKIICHRHGCFEQQPQAHLRSKIPCFQCSTENKIHDRETIIDRFKKAHKDRYDYSLVVYKKLDQKVNIICRKHGIFQQYPETHYRGFGCQKCQISKGETEIMEFLNLKGIKYEFQHKFPNCKNKNQLPFDFYIPNLNTCIEYNGIQHYKPVEWFGGNKTLEKVQLTDKIKKEYCLTKNIKLVIIKYDEIVVDVISSLVT